MTDSQLQSIVGRANHLEGEHTVVGAAVQETHLLKYDSACHALAEASDTDEVKDILDQALKLRLYAKLAENKQMERDATAIRVRAERRLGEMMAAQAKTVGKAKGAKGIGTSAGYKKTRTADAPPTLAEAGIDKNLAHRARNLTKLSQREFEKRVAEMRSGNRGNLDIRRAAKPRKCTVVRVDDVDSQADEVLDQAQRLAKSHRSSFLARAEMAGAGAQYDGPLEPWRADEYAILARNVAAKWSALAARFEQADHDAEEQAIARPGNEEHEHG